jgi:hypothetical protein
MSDNFTQDFFTSRRNYADGSTRIGELDRLWYDSDTKTIRIGDGVTPGGEILFGSSPDKSTWEFYVMNWDSTPQFVANITDGTVYSYTYNNVTRYRFVPSTYDSTLDSFYSSFNGTTLSDLIVSRGQ